MCTHYPKQTTSWTHWDAQNSPPLKTLLTGIGLHVEVSAKSVFATNKGQHEFTMMPFGMRTSPATFQRLVEIVLGAGLMWKVQGGWADPGTAASHKC